LTFNTYAEQKFVLQGWFRHGGPTTAKLSRGRVS